MNNLSEVVQYAVEIESLVKTFGNQRVVDNINLSIKQGEIFAILGPNGAGKTTLIRMLTTLTKPDEGQAKIFGYNVVKEPEKVRPLIALTSQYSSVDEDLTAEQNLMMFCELYGMDRKKAKTRTTELLQEFSLSKVATKEVAQFSGGMRRRLDLAISLIAKPKLLFLDEPTTGLDPRTRVQIWDNLRELSAEGSTLILTTQYLEEAEQLAERVAILDKGKLVALGTPNELKHQVGGIMLYFSVEHIDRLSEAKQIAEKIAQKEAISSEERKSIVVPVSGAECVQAVLAKLVESGITITELTMKRPSMDDVFFATTEENEQARNALVKKKVSRWGRPRR